MKVNASSVDDRKKRALDHKLAEAAAAFVAGDIATGCEEFSDFQNKLDAYLRSSRTTAALAEELRALIALAEEIRIAMGCP